MDKFIHNFFRYLPLILFFSLLLLAVGFSVNHEDKPVVAMSRENYAIKQRMIDSLIVANDSLQTEIFMLEDGFDSKEHRYEDIIFEYELGMSYLKDYHPKAYKDFHRIIGMRERFTAELERENSKRLKPLNSL
jgi:hypothetical protein